MGLWALCVSNGISDRDWANMTIPKIRALMKERRRLREFEIVLHGGKVEGETKTAKKAVFLSDIGIMPAQKGEQT